LLKCAMDKTRIYESKRDKKAACSRRRDKRRRLDPKWNIVHRIRVSMNHHLNGRIKGKLRHLDYSKEDLLYHINSKLEAYNYICPMCKKADLKQGYNVDHKIPICSAKNVDEVLALYALENLDVLCSHCNQVIKKDKLIDY
jgi:5-methylcytosine-specific restriction endonuclease McrA